MNVEEAIASHRAWKDSLQAAMTSPWNLDIDKIGGDHACRIGNWLHGQGELEYGHLPEYRRCVEMHAQFHAAAAHVARAINEGRLLYAQRELAPGSAYCKTSDNWRIALIAMFNAAKYFATTTGQARGESTPLRY